MRGSRSKRELFAHGDETQPDLGRSGPGGEEGGEQRSEEGQFTTALYVIESVHGGLVLAMYFHWSVKVYVRVTE
ncbi:MAG TPA: hypothetical protein VFD73_22805 [Gemmatimonadales bacterium]|nr:hypothetical protein [Gemmatimonadales bacterium]